MSVIVQERLSDKDVFLRYMEEADEQFKELIEDHLGKNIGPREDPIVLDVDDGDRLLMFRCDGRTFDYDLNQWVVDEAARAPLQREEHNKFCWLKGNRALFYARSFADFFTYNDHCKRTEVVKEMLALSRDVIFYYEHFGEHLSTLDRLENTIDELNLKLAPVEISQWEKGSELKTRAILRTEGDLTEEESTLTITATMDSEASVFLKEHMVCKYRLNSGLFGKMLYLCILHAACVVLKYRLENMEPSVVSDKTRKLTDGETAVANFLIENFKKECVSVLAKVDMISKLLSPMDMPDASVELVELEKMCRTLGVLRVECEFE